MAWLNLAEEIQEEFSQPLRLVPNARDAGFRFIQGPRYVERPAIVEPARNRRYAALRADFLSTAKCAHCQAPIKSVVRTMYKKYCDEKCNAKAYRKRKAKVERTGNLRSRIVLTQKGWDYRG